MREVETRRWTREEYYRMAERGVLAPDERVELIDGEILKIVVQDSRHFVAIQRAQKALEAAFGPGCCVRAQGPLTIDDCSEPEPDLAVVKGSVNDYRDAHPRSGLLVVEVSDTSVEFDRLTKGSLYARAGIPEYWIVNLPNQRLEAHRDPAPASAARFGWEYKSVHFYCTGQSVTPLHAPQAHIAVDDLLPHTTNHL